jgi:hypothetical protein
LRGGESADELHRRVLENVRVYALPARRLADWLVTEQLDGVRRQRTGPFIGSTS